MAIYFDGLPTGLSGGDAVVSPGILGFKPTESFPDSAAIWFKPYSLTNQHIWVSLRQQTSSFVMEGYGTAAGGAGIYRFGQYGVAEYNCVTSNTAVLNTWNLLVVIMHTDRSRDVILNAAIGGKGHSSQVLQQYYDTSHLGSIVTGGSPGTLRPERANGLLGPVTVWKGCALTDEDITGLYQKRSPFSIQRDKITTHYTCRGDSLSLSNKVRDVCGSVHMYTLIHSSVLSKAEEDVSLTRNYFMAGSC